MRLALKEAGLAFQKGEIPVGAVLTLDEELIGQAYNLREDSKDPTAHAEILALRQGASKGDGWRLTGATLYVTKEPCIMCAGAIVNSRIKRLVYGCKDSKAGGVDSLYNIPNDKRLNHQIEVVSGILEDECSEILKRFFAERR